MQAWQRNPDTIRRLLTHVLIAATDRKALFVGLDAYTTAGRTVQRDLFGEDRAAVSPTLPCWNGLSRSGWSARPRRSGQGWRWVGIGQEAQAAAWNLRRVWPDRVALSAEDEARRSELASRHNEIAEERNGGGDDLPEDPAPEPEDKTPAMSATLLAELDAHRTAGLQAAIAGQPKLALRVMLHRLATDAFYGRHGKTVAGFHAYPPALASACPGVADSPARQAMTAAENGWGTRLPQEHGTFWDWL